TTRRPQSNSRGRCAPIRNAASIKEAAIQTTLPASSALTILTISTLGTWDRKLLTMVATLTRSQGSNRGVASQGARPSFDAHGSAGECEYHGAWVLKSL